MDSSMAFDNSQYGSIRTQLESNSMHDSSLKNLQTPQTASFRISSAGKRISTFVSVLIISVLLFGIVAHSDNIYRNRVPHLFPRLSKNARASSLLGESGLHDAFYRVSYPDFAPLRNRGLHSYYAARNPSDRAMASYNGVAHSESSSCPPPVEDFSVDEMIPTGDCSRRRSCRARLIVIKEGSQVTIKAGYYIYTRDGKARRVDYKTKKRVKATTPKEAHKWADKLLSETNHQLEEVNCAATSDMVARAILEMKDVAASCPKIGDPRCDALTTVLTCTVPTALDTEADTECVKFVKTSPTITNLEELQGGCPAAEFYFNRVSVPLPFCTTTCPSNPCGEHTVYADFYVQTNKRGPNPDDCTSAALIPAYETFYETIPNCDDTVPVEVSRDRYLVPLFSIYDEQLPQNLLEIGNAYDCEVTYAFFMKESTTSLSDLVNSSCASIP